jgi:hypothetical protein
MADRNIAPGWARGSPDRRGTGGGIGLVIERANVVFYEFRDLCRGRGLGWPPDQPVALGQRTNQTNATAVITTRHLQRARPAAPP